MLFDVFSIAGAKSESGTRQPILRLCWLFRAVAALASDDALQAALLLDCEKKPLRLPREKCNIIYVCAISFSDCVWLGFMRRLVVMCVWFA